MMMSGRILLACLIVGSVACGDGIADRPIDGPWVQDDAPLPPDAASNDAPRPPDAAPPDATACPAPAAGDVGGACAINADCAAAGFEGLCQVANNGDQFHWPAEGFCFRTCDTTADCGAGAFCTTISGNQARALGFAPAADEFKVCFPECCEGNRCSPGRVCGDAIYGFITLEQDACFPGDGAATDGDTCEEFADCNVSSDCRDGDIEDPNGMCITMGCTVGDDSTCAPGGDGHCIADQIPGQAFGLPVCVDTCDTDADCRIADGYTCRDETAAGLGKFCWHAQIGDACTSDADCGGGALTCDTAQPGGSCTLACDVDTPCPDGDICVDPGNGDPSFCADRCATSDPIPCRTGYSCVVSTGGKSACLVTP